MSRYTLLTGATGSLGRYLLRDLLIQNDRVAVLARATNSRSVRERVEGMVQGWERELKQYLPRPQYFEGDLCQTNAGLSESDCVWIRRHCRRIVHCIAQARGIDENLSSSWPAANVNSVQQLLEVCRRCGIGDLHYVSSASVSGQRQGTILEDELNEGQDFDSAYDESRFQAELILQHDCEIRRKTIYRVCLLAGDAVTGVSQQGNPVTGSIQEELIRPSATGVVDDTSGGRDRSTQAQYVAPVDWAARAIGRILTEPEAWGRTFHVCPPQPLAQQEIAEAVRDYRQALNAEQGPSEFTSSDSLDSSAEGTDDNAPEYGNKIPFRTSLPKYDRTNLQKFAGDIPCPQIDRALIERYCESLNASSGTANKETPAQVEHWSDAVVSFARTDVIGALMDGLASTTTKSIGLDVVGAGGGQWSLQRGPVDLLTVTPGLPTLKVPVIRVTTVELSRLLEAPCERWSA